MWTFGLNELISLIAAIATFSAVIVSLYLALKSKTIKFKVFVKSNADMIIINTGDTKFTINCIGIKIGSDFYIRKNHRFSKVLAQSKEIKYSNNHTSSTQQEVSLSQVVVEQGDFVETGLEGFDFSLCNKSSKLFLVVNCKIHFYKFDFKTLTSGKSDNNEFKKYSKEQVKYAGLFTGI